MTDLIERPSVASAAEAVLEEHRGQVPAGGRPPSRSFSRPLTALLALILVCSAVLLLSSASSRQPSWRLGAGAAVVLVLLAAAVVGRPTRALMGWVVVAQCLVALWWAAARHGHAVGTLPAAVGIGLSAVAVATAAVMAARPATAHTWSSPTLVLGSVVPVGIVALTLVALFGAAAASPPSAPAKKSTAAAATPGGAAAALALAGSVTVPGENSKTFQSVVAGNETEQSELKKFVPLDPTTQAVLTQQLAQAYQAAMRFPTVASAKAAGMILAGGMAPGVGAHYQMINGNLMKGINPDGTVNPLYPASWIYASTADNAPVVGVMYEAFTENAPQGFAGPNDHWHQHSNVCVRFSGGEIQVPFAADQDVTPQECADVHGQFMKKTIWMVHAWVVPGWESPQGVFSHDNLHIYCPGNTDLTDAIGFCIRQQ
jgi:hypothetical protein